jgi:hypothetical protein
MKKKTIKKTKTQNKSNKKESYLAYMCSSDFFHERGKPHRGNLFFADLKNLKNVQQCVLPGKDSCGIVQVKIEFVKWIKEEEY